MSIFETLGFAWVILCVGLATAGFLICAAVGARHLYLDWKDGADQDRLERLTRQ